MASEPYTEPALGTGGPGSPGAGGESGYEGRSPWRLAMRRLRRNKIALAFGALFIVIVLFVLAAPLWATRGAETGPDTVHTTQRIEVGGEKKDVVDPSGKPIGPVWFDDGGKFFLG